MVAVSALAGTLAQQAVSEGPAMSLAGKCFLALIVLFVATEFLSYIVQQRRIRYPGLHSWFDKYLTEENMERALFSLNLCPVLSVLMLFIMFRISKLDQDIYDPMTNSINPAFESVVPHYPTIQLGYIATATGVYLLTLDMVTIRIYSFSMGNLSQKLGQPLLYLGYGVIIYGAIFMRNPDVPLSSAAQCLLILASTYFLVQFSYTLLQFMEDVTTGGEDAALDDDLLDVQSIEAATEKVANRIQAFTEVNKTSALNTVHTPRKTPRGPKVEPPPSNGSLSPSTATEDESAPLLQEEEAAEEATDDMAGPSPKDFHEVNQAALNPQNIFQKSKLWAALGTCKLIPNFMMLCFFIHFRMKEANGFGPKIVAQTQVLVTNLMEGLPPQETTKYRMGPLGEYTLEELGSLFMFVGTYGLVMQVVAVLVLKPLNKGVGVTVGLLGLISTYVSYSFLGFFVYAVEPIVSVEIGCFVALLCFMIATQVVIFLGEQGLLVSLQEYVDVRGWLHSLKGTHQYATMVGIAMVFIHYRLALINMGQEVYSLPPYAGSLFQVATVSILFKMAKSITPEREGKMAGAQARAECSTYGVFTANTKKVFVNESGEVGAGADGPFFSVDSGNPLLPGTYEVAKDTKKTDGIQGRGGEMINLKVNKSAGSMNNAALINFSNPIDPAAGSKEAARKAAVTVSSSIIFHGGKLQVAMECGARAAKEEGNMAEGIAAMERMDLRKLQPFLAGVVPPVVTSFAVFMGVSIMHASFLTIVYMATTLGQK